MTDWRIPSNAPTLTLDEAEQQLESLDLVVFAGKDSWASVAVRLAQAPSKFTHVGVVVRLMLDSGPSKELYLYQSTYHTGPRDYSQRVLHHQPGQEPEKRGGVKLTPLREAMDSYSGYCKGFRRLMWKGRGKVLTPEQRLQHTAWFWKCFNVFSEKHFQKPYERNYRELLRAAYRGNTEANTKYFFCSELVAELYIEVGLLPKNGEPSNNYDVISFTEEVSLNKRMNPNYWVGPIEYVPLEYLMGNPWGAQPRTTLLYPSTT